MSAVPFKIIAGGFVIDGVDVVDDVSIITTTAVQTEQLGDELRIRLPSVESAVALYEALRVFIVSNVLGKPLP